MAFFCLGSGLALSKVVRSTALSGPMIISQKPAKFLLTPNPRKHLGFRVWGLGVVLGNRGVDPHWSPYVSSCDSPYMSNSFSQPLRTTGKSTLRVKP